MRTAKDFKHQAEAKGITFWPLHPCSLCGYMCGYKIVGDAVWFDPGCWCRSGAWRQRTFADLAEHYNRQTHPRVVAEMDEFWGFEPEPMSQAEGLTR